MTDTDIQDPKIIVALDYANQQDALALVSQLDPSLCKLKVGKELFTAAGPQLVEQLVAKDFKVFLDLKFHDIPNTVAKACEAASNLGIWMLNVHASGGKTMMQSALEGVDKSAHNPYLIAVTVLTSMDAAGLKQLGVNRVLTDHVLNLATLTKDAGLHGVVCSALETQLLREHLGDDFCLVTPGIRPAGSAKDDQSRIVTPPDAMANGSSYLVIGRPITQSNNPQQAVIDIHQSLQ